MTSVLYPKVTCKLTTEATIVVKKTPVNDNWRRKLMPNAAVVVEGYY